MSQQDLKRIQPFLDEEGRITALPTKRAARYAVLVHLARQFPPDQEWQERQVNDIIDRWHTFGDYFVLRRELVDAGLLTRTRDGSRYWRTPEQPQEEML